MAGVLALSGGVGGAKLALGLDRILPAGALTVICNTGDDFEHLGLSISPDIDTVLYTLAGIANPETGWGRANETWTFMATLAGLGGDTWFRLGDADLAVHIERTRRLAAGDALSVITEHLRSHLGIQSTVLPMSNQPVRTQVETSEGMLPFQQYFVKRQCEPAVRGFHFDGASDAMPPPGLTKRLADTPLEAIIVCPSNPFISIDPILAVPGLRQMIHDHPAPVIAVSPVIQGRAVKGPTAKMMSELGLAVTSTTVAAHYGEFIDALVVDHSDDIEPSRNGPAVLRAATLMHSQKDKCDLAHTILTYARNLPSW